MARLLRDRRHKKGLAPGTPVYIGDAKNSCRSRIQITVLQGPGNVSMQSFESEDLSEVFRHAAAPDKKLWIRISGLPSPEDILRIGEHFRLSKLTLEDVLNTDHRPKGEELDEHVFIILKRPYVATLPSPDIHFEQISSFLGDGFVLTIQESMGEVFPLLHRRLLDHPQRFFDWGEDYLFYAQIDAVLDEIFDVVETIGARSDAVDQRLRGEFQSEDLIRIQDLRKDFLLTRRSFVPVRDFLRKLVNGEIRGVDPRLREYYLDGIDHAEQLIEAIDGYRDLLSGLVDVHLGRITHRSDETMKVLTFYASIFAPLTFIVGIYGMNFSIPEYHWKYGYLYCWILLIACTIVQVIYFKRKRWWL